MGIAFVVRLFTFQVLDVDALSADTAFHTNYSVKAKPVRGNIYDRNGYTLATTSIAYEPKLAIPINAGELDDPERPRRLARAQALAEQLAPYTLEYDAEELYAVMRGEQILYDGNGNRLKNLPFGNVRMSREQRASFESLGYDYLSFDEVNARYYPNGSLACHTVGYVNLDGEGVTGVEKDRNDVLRGREYLTTVSRVPFQRGTIDVQHGADIYLTIDKSLQELTERHLAEAVNYYDAKGGMIMVLEPSTGNLLSVANYPCYDLNLYNDQGQIPDELSDNIANPMVELVYEPGSTFKLFTMAAALDSGTVVPSTTYYDGGEYNVGGQSIFNADKLIYGTVDMQSMLANSLNTGMSWLAVTMGDDTFYSYLNRFHFGKVLGVSLPGEVGGIVHKPGTENSTLPVLARNAFGQAISVTPLQMVAAVSAIANEGVMMQPHIIQKTSHDNGDVEESVIEPLSQAVSAETARHITNMAIEAGHYAEVDTYTIAGKTGTAQIPLNQEEGGIAGYHPTETIQSFVGWFPAKAPEVVILYRLDRPTKANYASESAAPAFGRLINEMAVLLEVTPNNMGVADADVEGEASR